MLGSIRKHQFTPALDPADGMPSNSAELYAYAQNMLQQDPGIQVPSYSASVTHNAESFSPAPTEPSMRLRPHKKPPLGFNSAEDCNLDNVCGSSDEEGSECDT